MPFTPKPQASTGIALGHPHARGLILAVPFLEGAGGAPDAASSAAVKIFHDYGPLQRHGSPVASTAPNVPGWTVGPSGLLVRVGGPGSNERLDFGDSSLILPTSGGFTWVMGYQKFDTTARTTQMGVVDATPFTKRAQLSLPFSDGNIYWDWGGVTAGTSRLSVAMPTPVNVYAVWAFTIGPRGMEIWKDGKLLASNSGNATRVSSTASFTLGGSSTTDSDKSDYAFVYLYGRQIEPGIIQSLAVDPYAMLRESRLRRYILLSRPPLPFTITAPAVVATWHVPAAVVVTPLTITAPAAVATWHVPTILLGINQTVTAPATHATWHVPTATLGINQTVTAPAAHALWTVPNVTITLVIPPLKPAPPATIVPSPTVLSVTSNTKTPPSTVLTSPTPSAGSNQGGVGFTKLYTGASGEVPVGDDPSDGETFLGKKSQLVWVEITHSIG